MATTTSTRQTTFTDENEFMHDFLRRSIPNAPRSPYTVVSRSALTFNATDRLIELSRPKLKKDHLIREGSS
jgi:hypothetical protein